MPAATVTDAPRRAGLRGFLGALIATGPWRLAWVIAVQVAAGLGQAAGVLLLVPLLAAVGVRSSSGVARFVHGAFQSAGVRPTLAAVLAAYVAVTALTAGLSAYQSVLATRYRLEFVDRLRVRLYDAIAHAQWRHLLTIRQSDILAVLSTNVSWVGLGTLAALQLLVAVIVVGAQLAASIRISPVLTGLAVLAGIGLIALVWPLVRRSRRLARELIDQNRGVLGLTTGFLDALKLTKAYGREDDHVESFSQAITAARGSQIGFARASAIATAVQMTLTAAMLAAVVELSQRRLHVALGSLIVVVFVFTRVVSQLASVQSQLQQVAQALPAFDEIRGLIDSCERAREVTPERRPLARRVGIGEGVALADVHFHYPGRVPGENQALSGVSFEIPRGSMVALAGPSGAGKTTAADLIAGLLEPTAGTVLVAGRPLTGERMLGWRASVALVPQDPFLFHDTIAANLAWGRPDATEAEVWQALEAAAAAAFVEQLPAGLQTVVGDRGLRLSGGERQRLALARALLRGPDLLILDEATSSLDTENELAIRSALQRLRDRTTMLVIAHRLSTASEADQVIVLDRGRVAEAGTWDELSQLPTGRLQALIEAGAAASS